MALQKRTKACTGKNTGDAGRIFTLDLYKVNTGISSLFIIPFTANFYLLVDTGAAYTIIDEKFARETLHIKPTGIPQPVLTPGGDKLLVAPINLEFLGTTYRCYTGSINLFLSLFSAHTVGILGSDVLSAMDAVIDMGNLTITLTRNQGESGRIAEDRGGSGSNLRDQGK